MKDYIGYIALGIVAIIALLFYGNSREKAGKAEADKEWMAKFIVPPETVSVVTHDTLRMPPETLRFTRTIYLPVKPDEHNLCSGSRIFFDTLGGEHSITVDKGEIAEVFTPAPQRVTTITLERQVPINNEKNWMVGISAELDKELGVGLLVVRKPLFVLPRYYIRSKSFGFGMGLSFEF